MKKVNMNGCFRQFKILKNRYLVTIYDIFDKYVEKMFTKINTAILFGIPML